MTGGFRASYPLRFAHCDPAGIAYYPRYFEICDGAIEDWCEQILEVPRRVLHLDMGLALPTVRLAATFSKPSRLGDLLDVVLTVGRIGKTSLELEADVSCAGEKRFGVSYTQVLMNMADGRPVPWPIGWRQRLAAAAVKEQVA